MAGLFERTNSHFAQVGLPQVDRWISQGFLAWRASDDPMMYSCQHVHRVMWLYGPSCLASARCFVNTAMWLGERTKGRLFVVSIEGWDRIQGPKTPVPRLLPNQRQLELLDAKFYFALQAQHWFFVIHNSVTSHDASLPIHSPFSHLPVVAFPSLSRSPLSLSIFSSTPAFPLSFPPLKRWSRLLTFVNSKLP